MTKKFAKHLPHYFSLIGMLVAAFVGIIIFSYDQFAQAAIIIAAAMGYVAWGIVHHTVHHDLTISVIIEYIAMALIGVTAALSLLYRG